MCMTCSCVVGSGVMFVRGFLSMLVVVKRCMLVRANADICGYFCDEGLQIQLRHMLCAGGGGGEELRCGGWYDVVADLSWSRGATGWWNSGQHECGGCVRCCVHALHKHHHKAIIQSTNQHTNKGAANTNCLPQQVRHNSTHPHPPVPRPHPSTHQPPPTNRPTRIKTPTSTRPHSPPTSKHTPPHIRIHTSTCTQAPPCNRFSPCTSTTPHVHTHIHPPTSTHPHLAPHLRTPASTHTPHTHPPTDLHPPTSTDSHA